jgi:hypothetical protein
MALITCPECKGSVSDSIDSCPHCGYKIKQSQAKEINTNPKIGEPLMVIVIIFALICLIGYSSSLTSKKETIQTSLSDGKETVVETVNEISVKSDHDLCLSFSKDLTNKLKALDIKYDAFRTILNSGDDIYAIEVAPAIDMGILKLKDEIDVIEIPDLKNKVAKQELIEAKEQLSTSCLYKWSVAHDFIEYSKNPSPFNFVQVKKDMERAQDEYVNGMVKLASAQVMVGIKAKEVNPK